MFGAIPSTAKDCCRYVKALSVPYLGAVTVGGIDLRVMEAIIGMTTDPKPHTLNPKP